MNELLRGILIIYVTSTLFYFIYKKYSNSMFENIINNLNNDDIEKYNKIKRYRITAFIIGVLVGIAILIFLEPDTINKTKKYVVDISDINVIS